MARSTDVVLSFDLGGTKLLAALVDGNGRVLAHNSKKIDQTRGLRGLYADFKFLASQLPPKKFKSVAVASAGPLHSEKGVLLDPTNFFTGGESWGVVPLVKELKKIFKKSVLLENDAAAAVCGEAWKGGHGKSSKNIVMMTLGTGVGIGIVANGELVRAGRGLHPEASHMPINAHDVSYPCGCGANGCIEAYLSGPNFALRLGARVGRSLAGEDCVKLAEEGNAEALDAFRQYGASLAQAIRTLSVCFAPEVVVLGGGFAKAAPYFVPEAERVLPTLLERYREGFDLLPKIRVSKLGERAGVIGAARLAN